MLLRAAPLHEPDIRVLAVARTIERRLGQFFALFSCCFLAGFAALLTPPAKVATLRFSRTLVTVSAALIHVAGGSALAEGTVLRDPTTSLAVEMKDGCNGLYVTVLLCSALLAYRASWKRKTNGILIGLAAIQSVNLVRFVSLFYLLQLNRAWFDFAHEYLWESLIMLDALTVFGIWVQTVFRAEACSARA